MILRHTLLAALACAVLIPPAMAQYSLTGIVVDASSGGPLPGANVLIPSLSRGTVAGTTGEFQFHDLPVGRHPIHVSFVGFTTKDTVVVVPSVDVVHIQLEPDAAVIDEVLIEAWRDASSLFAQTPVSAIKVSELPVHRIPAFLAERDLLRVVQQLPGVKTESDFTGGLHVRGGRNDQNLILLDGVPVYNPWHLFGLFSAFNAEALDDVTLSKGVFPARYGSRVSSVLEASLSDPLDSLTTAHVNVSIVSAQTALRYRFNEHTALLIAGRRTYLDPFFYMYDSGRSTTDLDPTTRYNFTDVNLKLVRVAGGGNRLEAGLFYNDDRFRLSEDSYHQSRLSSRYDGLLKWRNLALSIRHQLVGGDWSLTSRVYSTNYVADFSVDDAYWSHQLVPDHDANEPGSRYSESLRQRLVDLGFHTELDYPLAKDIRVLAGFELISHRLSDRVQHAESVRWSPDHVEDKNRHDGRQTAAWEYAAFMTLEARAGIFSLYPAVRLERYTPGDYGRLMPRLNVVARPSHRFTLSAGGGRFAQYVHVVGNDKASLPTDRWFFSDHDMPPIAAWGATIGGSYSLSIQESISVEGYYKRLAGLRAYTPQALDDAMEGTIPLLPRQTIAGSGESYGLELFYQRTAGRLAGWAGYTIAWTFNRFDDLNYGRPFPARTDRRHDLQLAASYAVSSEWDLGATFKLQSGQPTTLATQGYVPVRDPFGIDPHASVSPFVVTETNSFRMPRYHRLDVSATRKGFKVSGRPAELIISVFNVYNQFNVFDIAVDSQVQESHDGGVRVIPRNRYLSQLPILPMIGLRINLNRKVQE